MVDAFTGLLDFFDQIWGETEGFVYLPVKEKAGRVRKFFLPWPQKREAVARHVLKWSAAEDCEVFFSPALYSEMKATNDAVKGSHVAWVDFDGNFPEEWPDDVAPIPSIEVQSSSDRKRHAYWRLAEFTEPKAVERINRSLAYAFEADTSGWDANQFLRPPFSVNRKYRKPIMAKVVADRSEIKPYRLKKFEHLPSPAEAIREDITLSELPDIDEVKTLATWDEDALDLFNTTGEEARSGTFDRSSALARLAYKGAELAWTDEQIFVALTDADARWGKYVGRHNREKILVELINRARAKVGYDVGNDKSLMASLLKRVDVEPDEPEIPDFVTIDQLNAVPGIDNWVVEGLLTPTGIGLFTGRPGTGKTQLVLQLAADLATGRDSFLHFPLPGKPMKVMFLSLEMSGYQLQHFTTRLRTTYPEPELDKNLIIYSRGEALALHTDEGQHLVDAWFDQYQPDVVIVDSFSQAATDLSSDDQMKSIFDFLRALRRYHKTAMVFVHHHRKKANDAASRKQANSQSDIYGSFQIAASVDFALDLEDRNDEYGELDLQLLKARFMHKGETKKVVRDDNLHFTLSEMSDKTFDRNLTDPDGKGLSLGL